MSDHGPEIQILAASNTIFSKITIAPIYKNKLIFYSNRTMKVINLYSHIHWWHIM